MSASKWENDSSSRDPTSEYQVIGNYAVGETIGKGSFGKVKKGRHLPTGETVAIKILNREKIESANMDKKIVREINILKLFSHPNICRLYEVISTPTDIYLIMEYAEGGELYNYILKKGMLKEDAARYILQQIVCALEYCHHFRVVHRDLKPENILLGPGLQVKLIDFGLSNIMKDGEFLATSCGSPNYAAPEVISGKLYFGPEVDVWSCGVILYALLCGCLPFDEDTIPLLFSKIKKGRYHTPSHVPVGARELIAQILVVDPLVRLTIPQIRDNVWFNINLPTRLSYNESIFLAQENRISRVPANRAAKLLNLRDRDVRSEIEKGSGPGFVAYSILVDVDRRKEIVAEAESLAVEDDMRHVNHVATHISQATERELNLGLLLTPSPAMEVLLNNGDATANKHLYNGGNFVPASVQDVKPVALSLHTTKSGGAFSISRHQCSLDDRSLSPNAQSAQRPATVGATTRWESGSGLTGSGGDRQRVGSVAKSHLVFTSEEEEFIVRNNIGWRVGLMCDFNAATSLSIVYSTFISFSMEWKLLSPFCFLVRTRESSWEQMSLSRSSTDRASPLVGEEDNLANSLVASGPSKTPRVVLAVYLFRIHEKHDKGYLIDFSILSGGLLAMDVVLRLSSEMIQRIKNGTH